MQKCQKLFMASIHAIVQACGKSTGEVKTTLTRALVPALSDNREFNLTRRELLRPDLNTQYASLCNPSTPITTSRKANKIGNKISSSRTGRGRVYHPYGRFPSRGSSSSTQMGGRGNRYLLHGHPLILIR